MKRNGWSLKESFDFVKERREVISPNPGFMEQLCEYEMELFNACTMPEYANNSKSWHFISYFYSFIYLLFQLTAEWSRRSLFLYSLVFVMSWWLGGSNKAKQTAREQQRKRTEDRRRILRAAEACNPANLAAALDGCQGADINYHSSLAYDGCPFGTCNPSKGYHC